jgi:hypothetical protein
MDRGQITAHGRVAQAGWEGEMVAANELRRPSEGQAGEEDFFFREEVSEVLCLGPVYFSLFGSDFAKAR